MIETYRYQGASGIANAMDEGRVAFATNTLRETTYFDGELGKSLLFREGLGALYDVVMSDFKYRPRDRVAFKAWLEDQDRRFLANLSLRSEQARARMQAIEARLAELEESRTQRLGPFYRARRHYFDYVYTHEYETAYLFDPVITVHPDELSFEAFSRDESSYARLAAKYDLFDKVGSFECGTTNIDFSAALHTELDRMRTYRRTRFEVSPSGFSVAHGGGAAHKEKKIELPDSWVMGFLQVHSTMSMGLTHLTLAPIDLFNILHVLLRRKARASPRALRYELVPGQPVRVVFEPWEQALTLSPASIFQGAKPTTVRTWGRERLRTLARLLPVARSVDLYLAGFGLPSIYVVDLGPLVFTLGLSGWTDNDWAGGKAKFDLLTRRADVTADELARVHAALSKVKRATDAAIAADATLSLEKARSALSYLCQIGRGMYDLAGGVYRHRELFLEPFTVKHAQAAVTSGGAGGSPQEKAAKAIFDRGDVRLIARRPAGAGFKLSGSAKGADGHRVRPLLSVDAEGKIVEGTCTCEWFRKHKLTQGPCEHLLSLRLAHMATHDAHGTKP